MPNSGLYDNEPNSRSDILYAFNSGSHILTMPLSSQLFFNSETNEIRSASDNKHARSRATSVFFLTMAAPIQEATLGVILNHQQTLENTLMFDVKQLEYQTPITVNRVEKKKLHVGEPESQLPDDDNIEEIQKTMSNQPDINME